MIVKVRMMNNDKEGYTLLSATEKISINRQNAHTHHVKDCYAEA